jgi:predicted  nucleic acid-binding Zn-ribbon protein
VESAGNPSSGVNKMATQAERIAIVETQLTSFDKRFDQHCIDNNTRFGQLDIKIDRLETKVDTLESKVDKLDEKVTFIHDKLQSQNGAIPRMQEDLKTILTQLDSTNRKYSIDMPRLLESQRNNSREITTSSKAGEESRLVDVENAKTLAKVGTRLNILWAAAGIIGTIVIGGFFKIFFGF